MELFLRMLLKLSLLGSVLALVLTVLRPLLRRWVSRKAAYYLWLLVLLRLCIPAGFDLPVPVAAEEPVSVSPPTAQTVPVLPPNDPADIVIEPEPGERVDTPETVPQPAPSPGPSSQAEPAPVQAASALSTDGPAEWLKSPYLWGALWWFGTLASVGWFMLGYLRVSGTIWRTAGTASPEALAILRELDPKGRVQLVESPAVNTPLLLGAVRPVIVLPFDVTDTARLRDILTHELTHVRRHDLLFKWFAAMVTSLHWFNPVMLLVRREIGRACELACDEAVMRGLDSQGRRHYGETLLVLAAHAPRGLGPLAVTLCEEKKQLKERLACIVKYKKSGPMVLFLSLVLAAVLGACAMVTGVKPVTPDAPEPPEEEGQVPEEEQELLENVTLYELDGGLTIAFPNDIADQLIIKPRDESWQGDDRLLLTVYEKKSYEDTLADWDYEGGGYLFGIDRYTQAQYEEYLTGDGSGISPFATDGTSYYMYTFATDVQFYRSDIDTYTEESLEPWYQLEEHVGVILEDFIARNGLKKLLSVAASDLYQRITETRDSDYDYDFTARVEEAGHTMEFHITGENGNNVAYIGNNLPLPVQWHEAEEADWLAQENPGTVLTLLSADGNASIRCRSGDNMVALTQDGETRYARLWDPPELLENPNPNVTWSLWTFMMKIPNDAFGHQIWAGTADGNLSPAEAAQHLAEQVAENYRNIPDWLDWKPMDIQVADAKIFDAYYGEDVQFCFVPHFLLLLDDPNYIQWQAGSGLGDPIADGPFTGYYDWGREALAAKNSDGDWYIVDFGTGGYSVNLPGWTLSYGMGNYLGNASLEELADLFYLTEGETHDYLLPKMICERPAEELAGLSELLDRHTRPEAQELCRALAAYLNAGYGADYGDTLASVDDLNALLAPAYHAYTADVPALWQ